MLRPRVAWTCLGAAMSLAGVALAQPAGEAARTRAASLVNRAQQACAGGAHQEALAALDTALGLYPHARIRYRTGVEHQHLGHLIEAMEALEGYLSEPEREPEYVADAVSRINQIRPSLGALDLLADPGVAVEIDGRPRGLTPMARVRLPAGRHRIAVSKPGFASFQTTVQVIAGQTTPLPVKLQPQEGLARPPEMPPPPDPAPAPPTGPPPAPLAIAGRDVAGAGPPIEIGLLFSGGVWTSGLGETGTTVGAALGGSYRILGDRLSFHLGPRLIVNTINDLGRTVYATSFLLAPLARLAVVPGRFQASFELGSGLLVIWGLRPRSMILIPQSSAVTGGLSAVALRPALTLEYLLNREVALLMGMAAAWSPRPDPAFRERNLLRVDFAVGLSWSL